MNIRNITRALVIASVSSTVGFASVASAQEVPAAEEADTAIAFVQMRGDEIIAIINQRPTDDATREARLQALRSSISGFLDIGVLAREALGSHWDPRTEAERTAFVALMTDLIETSYSKRLGDEGIEPGSYTVTWDGERSRNGRTRVESTVTVDGETHAVEVMLREEEGRRIVYDLITDDVSLKDSYAESFDSIITEHGWDELMSRMQSRLEELRAE
jgi:phospholipid transport system substrate-binding protein